MIGYSEDYKICIGKNTVNASNLNGEGISQKIHCKQFLNKSVETLCHQHAYAKKLENMDRLKAGRLNIMGDRVDCNAIKRMDKMLKQENVGAFGKNQLHRVTNRPVPMLSPKSQALQLENKDKMKGKFDSFMNQRALKFAQNRKDPLLGLQTQEKSIVVKQLGKAKVEAPKQDDDSSDGLDFGDEPVDFKKKRPLTDISASTNQSKVVEMMLKRRKV